MQESKVSEIIERNLNNLERDGISKTNIKHINNFLKDLRSGKATGNILGEHRILKYMKEEDYIEFIEYLKEKMKVKNHIWIVDKDMGK